MLLDTLTASLFGNVSTGKPKITGQEVIRVDEGTIRVGQGFLCSLIFQLTLKY